MSECNFVHENFHTKHSVLTAPDEHMPYIIQLHVMSMRWAYYEQRKQQNIWSVYMTSIGKENRPVSAYLIKNTNGEGRERKVTLTSSRKDLVNTVLNVHRNRKAY